MALNLLVVDDEEDFLRSIVMRIELRGIQASGVTSGADALKHLAENPGSVDVVLLDIKMPGMDGIETLRRIKEQDPKVEVIVVTGHASQEFERLGRENGASAHLVKPVRLETILEHIEIAAQRRGIHNGC